MKKQLLLSCLAAGISLAANAQSNVTTGTTKNVILHEGTGVWCGWCVDGALKMETMMASDPKLIGVAVHNGDAMAFGDGNTYNSEYATGYPYGTVDNVVQNVDANYPNSVGMGRTSWQQVITSQEAKPAKYQITMSHAFTAATNTITVTLTGKALAALSGQYNFNVYIVEDSVTGPNGTGYSQKNFYANNNTYPTHPFYSQPATINGYVHRKVLRAMLGGTWGVKGATNPAINSIAQKTFTYVVPAGAKLNYYKIVGLVLKDNPSNAQDREIMNSVQAKFYPAKVGISTTVALDDIATYPNPANGSLRVTGSFHEASDLNLTLSNSLGQTVLTKHVPYTGSSVCDETLDVSSLANGIYFLNIRSEAGQSSVRVMVSH